MGPGLLASDDLPWKEALGTYLCTDRCVGFGLVAPERLEDGEAGEVLQGPEKLVVHENWVCRAPALGGGSRILQETLLAPHPGLSSLPPPHKARPAAASHNEEGSSAVGTANPEPSAQPLPAVPWYFLPQGASHIPVSPAHGQLMNLGL